MGRFFLFSRMVFIFLVGYRCLNEWKEEDDKKKYSLNYTEKEGKKNHSHDQIYQLALHTHKLGNYDYISIECRFKKAPPTAEVSHYSFRSKKAVSNSSLTIFCFSATYSNPTEHEINVSVMIPFIFLPQPSKTPFFLTQLPRTPLPASPPIPSQAYVSILLLIPLPYHITHPTGKPLS